MHVLKTISKIGLAAFLVLGGLYTLFGMTSAVFLAIIAIIAIVTGILVLFTLRDRCDVDHKYGVDHDRKDVK